MSRYAIEQIEVSDVRSVPDYCPAHGGTEETPAGMRFAYGPHRFIIDPADADPSVGWRANGYRCSYCLLALTRAEANGFSRAYL